MNRLTTLFIVFTVLIFACTKTENINKIKTAKGGYAHVIVRSGFDSWDSVLIDKSFTVTSFGAYQTKKDDYTVILEELDSTGKLVNYLFFSFTKGSTYSANTAATFVSNKAGVHSGTVYALESNTSSLLQNLQESNVGGKMSGTLSFPSPRGSGEFYDVEVSFEAYRLPDHE